MDLKIDFDRNIKIFGFKILHLQPYRISHFQDLFVIHFTFYTRKIVKINVVLHDHTDTIVKILILFNRKIFYFVKYWEIGEHTHVGR